MADDKLRPGSTPEWSKKFLAHLEEKPVVSYACRYAGISRNTAYKWKKIDPTFSDEWDEQMEAGLDQVEEDLLDLGTGAKRGQVAALIYYLKARRYEKRTGTDMPSKLVLEWGGANDDAS